MKGPKVRVVPVLQVLAVLLVLTCTGASAQPPAAPYVGKRVTAVTLTIEGRPSTEPALMSAVQVKVGAPLAMADVRETITHLYTLGRVDDVRVEADTVSDGVAIAIVLEPIHVVTKVEFRGQLGLSEGTLRDRMSERFGATPPVTRINDVAAALTQLYAERGYLAATVTPGTTVLHHDPDRATLVFDVDAGPRTVITKASVTGRPLEAAARIEERLHIGAGEPYQPADLQDRLASYVAWMRHRGYYQADARAVDARFTAGRREVEVTVELQPGPLVAVRFAGDPLPKDKLAELVPIEREGSVDEDILEDAAHRITDYLQQQGYWKAAVRAPERKEEDGRLTLVFHIARGPLYRVAPGGLQITGTQAIPVDELKVSAKLDEAKLSAGDPFVASRMSAVEGAIKQRYRERGFATAEVESQPNETAPGIVQPVIVVKEGPRIVLGSVSVTGNEHIAAADLFDEKTAVKSGEPYYGPALAAARDRMTTVYLDRGFLSADVTVPRPAPAVEGNTGRADVVFQVREGPQTTIEHIFITGNLRTNPDVIRHEIRIHEGGPLGQSQLAESRRNLAALGLFRRIQISGVSHGDSSRSDVVIAVEEAQRTTIGYGGGVEADWILRAGEANGPPVERFELAPRGFFEVGRRNLGGKNRSVNLYTRFGLRPKSNPDDSNPFGFSEYRVVGTYREPGALGSLGELTGTAAIEQGVRTGFNFAKKGLNAELTHRFSSRLRGSGRYSFSTTHIFDPSLSEEDQLTVDRVFSEVRLSSFSGALSHDTRDDLLEPRRGTFLSGDATLAGRAIGSEIGYGKVFVQGFVYKSVGRPNLVFAGAARVGAARTFLRQKSGEDVRDLPASERFFAGGDTTIRGFRRDAVGAPETLTPNGFPKGGDAEMIFNAELRIPVKGDIGAVVFADAGNVFARAADLSLAELRTSLGFGLRYRTPIGPIRLDFGFPVDRHLVGTKLERRFEPHFSIGHAF